MLKIEITANELQFITSLYELQMGDANLKINNQELMGKLPFSEVEFQIVKEALLRKGIIRKGGMLGGSLSFCQIKDEQLLSLLRKVEPQSKVQSQATEAPASVVEIKNSILEQNLQSAPTKFSGQTQDHRPQLAIAPNHDATAANGQGVNLAASPHLDKVLFEVDKFGEITLEDLAKMLEVSIPDAKGKLSDLLDYFPQGKVIRESTSLYFKIHNIEPKDKFTASKTENFKWINPDEREAAELLANVLSAEELQGLCGEFGRLTRLIHKIDPAKDQKLINLDLASSLLAQFHTDLFAEEQIRNSIGIKLGISNIPNQWKPGSVSALEFVKSIGFPVIYAGEPSLSRHSRLSFLKRKPISPLAEYQEFARHKIFEIISHPGNRSILRMPTSTGKTRIGIQSVHDWYNSRIASGAEKAVAIWVTHSEELCEYIVTQMSQLYNNLADLSFDLDIYRLWGSQINQKSLLADSEWSRLLGKSQGCYFLVTSTQTLNQLVHNSAEPEWIRELFSKSENLTVIDEADCSLTKTYSETINTLHNLDSNVNILGLTSTQKSPQNAAHEPNKAQELYNLFSNNVVDPFSVHKQPRKYLVDQQLLAKPIFDSIETGFEVKAKILADLNNEDPENWDLAKIKVAEAELSIKVNNYRRRFPIVKKMIEMAKANAQARILYFAVSEDDADLVAWHLRKEGIKAESIHAKTKSGERRKVLTDFKVGDTTVLCHSEVLTADCDDPKITHLFIAQPCLNVVLYEQMLGRGLRGPKFGGAQQCFIFNVADQFEPAISGKLAWEKTSFSWVNELNRPPDQDTNADGSPKVIPLDEQSYLPQQPVQVFSPPVDLPIPPSEDEILPTVGESAELVKIKELIEAKSYGAAHSLAKILFGSDLAETEIVHLLGMTSIELGDRPQLFACMEWLKNRSLLNELASLQIADLKAGNTPAA